MSRQIIKKGSSGAIAVFISRIFGLLRDILLARFVGGGAIMSAWVLAFRIPNTFRRFFGEGAASQALIPMLEHIIQEKGIEKAKKDFGTIFATLGAVLAVISILIGLISILLMPHFYSVTRIYTTLLLLPILMPYTVFICLTGICGGILNLFGKFFLPALSSVILNLFIIAALIIFSSDSSDILITKVSWAVLLSGIAQLIAMLYLLKKANMFPSSFVPALLDNSAIKEFISLAIPGFIGAAAVQINTLVDSFIAIYLGNYAAPALYYSERIIYLPLGIFAVSIGNASLVTMSKYAADKNYKKLASAMSYGLRQIIYITIPICLFFVIFRTQILTLIFSGDKFGQKEVSEAAWAMLFYGFGIPAFAGVKIVISGFYSQKDMKTPLKIALLCVAINFILNLILMWPLQQGGIALSTTISSYLNVIILFFIFIKRNEIKRTKICKEVITTLFKILFGGIIAITISWIAFAYLNNISLIKTFDCRSIITLVLSGIVFAIFYFSYNLFTRSSEQNEWIDIFANKFSNK
jgi:putative peptidoglycan lipid II flippase